MTSWMSRAGWIVLGLAALTACSGGGTADREIEIESVPVVTETSTLPYERYALDAQERRRLSDAYTSLLVSCAKSYGVTLVPTSAGDQDPSFQMWNGRFGTMTLDHARRWGYHAGRDEPTSAPYERFLDEQDSGQAAVLRGPEAGASSDLVDADGRPVPRGGCLGAVRTSVGGDPRAVVYDDAERFRRASFEDPRTTKAIAAWVGCMKRRGFDYDRVDQPADAAVGNPLTRDEIAIATADVQCTRSSRWRDISFAIESAYEARAVSSDPERFRDGLAKQRALLRRAEALASRG